PTYIFLSHLHIDHIVGLHVLEKFRFAEELKIYTPVNTEVELKNFLRQPFTMPLSSLPFKAEIYPALEKFFLPGIKVKTLELMHSTKCIGYRIQVENKSIVYCTDTGVCDNIIKLAKQADLLITECALKQDEGLEGWPHLNPIDAANLAKESQVRKLVLTHFDAHNYQNKNERNVAQARAEKIFPAVLSAFDRLELDI
ncbi:MAG: ribonuclease Z, partial [Candidatus Omnitrophota bacterium]